MGGIYKIIIDKNYYIGRAVDIKRRIRRHKNELQKGAHINVHMQRSYDKYGKLEYRVLEEVSTIREQKIREQAYIDDHIDDPNCMNLSTSSEGGCGIHSEETKQKIRIANLGKQHTPETKQKLSCITKLWFSNGHQTEEHKKRLSDSLKGKKKGPMSDEHKANLSEAISGRTLDDAHKKAISEGCKGVLVGAKNGSAKTITVVMEDGTEYVFDTIADCIEHFDITRAQFPSLKKEQSRLKTTLGIARAYVGLP